MHFTLTQFLQNAILDEITHSTPLIGQICESKAFYFFGGELSGLQRDDIFRLLPSNCKNWKIYCDDHSSLSSTTAVQIWISHNYISQYKCACVKKSRIGKQLTSSCRPWLKNVSCEALYFVPWFPIVYFCWLLMRKSKEDWSTSGRNMSYFTQYFKSHCLSSSGCYTLMNRLHWIM